MDNIFFVKFKADFLAKARDFFAKRSVLEVETPLMSASAVTDPNLNSFCVDNKYYLATSPEFAMKKLLVAGSGSIYQICKAFRKEEIGRIHRQEFTMLEWYRIDFDHHKLMDEMDEFLNYMLGSECAERISYSAVFQKHLGIEPIDASVDQLKKCFNKLNLQISDELMEDGDRDIWLQILFHQFEPKLGLDRPIFIYDYPASQAALARISKNDARVAERFEVYIRGIEIANGFHELADAQEQRQRFMHDLEKRRALNLPAVPIDEEFLAALEKGLPDCAGVALGIDRLMMLALNANSI